MLKEIIEILFSKGFIKVLFATETFAVGINMPTKTAVFVGVKKYDEQYQDMRVLTTAEYLQMAGRAGRRGLDTMGTVIYLPDRNPIEPYEMHVMMCGGRAEVTSRMEFDYDFILKTIQSGNRSWLDILEKSYWRRQRQVQITSLEDEQIKLNSRLGQINLTADELEAVQVKVDLEQQLTTLTNAKRKKAELQLSRWKDEYTGPKWERAIKLYDESKSIQRELSSTNSDIAILSDTSSSVERKIRVLEQAGFLKPLDDPKMHTKESLTTVGVLATELNECDALLISQFYLTDIAKKLTPMELLAVLASCIVDGKSDNSRSLSDTNVPDIVKHALFEINDIWDKLRTLERAEKSVVSPWKMDITWIDPLWDWMKGDPVGTICSNYEIYEGNLIRSVLKLQNMLDEWRSMATFCEHTDVLDKFKDAHTLLLREAVIQDSLYLHM
jgi:superfamily II RNA helicase